MEIKKEILPKSRIKLNIKVSSPEMRGFFSRVYNKLASSVEIKGFRRGMAPKSLTIAAIGENRLNSEIVDLALQETYTTALKKENLLPVSQPKVNIKMLKDLTVDTAELEYEAEIDVLPVVKLGNFKEIKIRKEDKEIKVDKEEVEHVLSHLQRQKAEFKDIDRPLESGDRAEINFEGFERGAKLENLSSEHYPVILGSGTLIGDFEKNLIGLKKGEKKEFKVELIDPKNPKLPKKPTDFKVEILQTQEVIMPKLNDEFAQSFQKKSLEDLKKAIKDDIIFEKKEMQKKNLENRVLESLLNITEVEIPESLIEREVEHQIENMRQRLTKTGLDFEKYLENLKKTVEELRQDIRPQAEKLVKIGLALGEVAKKEGIDPKDKEAGKMALEKLIKYNLK